MDDLNDQTQPTLGEIVPTSTEDTPSVEKIMRFLEGITYPASRDELVEWAAQQTADDNILGVLEALMDQKYDTTQDVVDALSEITPVDADRLEMER